MNVHMRYEGEEETTPLLGRLSKLAAGAVLVLGSLTFTAPAANAAPWPDCLKVDTKIHIWDQTTTVTNKCGEQMDLRMVINNQPDSQCLSVGGGGSVDYKYLRHGQFAYLEDCGHEDW
ncbi:hypothetical protein [Actinopolyspora mortivallis]|nr:hypothetical protein [Actinopolyspora mortivallis]